MIASLVLEGTWDEICARADELRGCRVRLTVLSRTPMADQPGPTMPARQKPYTPGPVILDTVEYPNPVDLPRLRKGVRVKPRRGGKRC